VVVAKGSNFSKSTDAVRDEVLAGRAMGQVGDNGDRGGRGGGALKLSCDFVIPMSRGGGMLDFRSLFSCRGLFGVDKDGTGRSSFATLKASDEKFSKCKS
jgi:hypothetical protein